jgi:hypothetical protein
MIFLEAASGFEPLHKGFADLSLSHLGTPPLKQEKVDRDLIPKKFSCLFSTVCY